MSDKKVKKVKVKFLNSPAVKYRLSANVNDEASLPEPLAIEIVENKDAVFVNKADEKLLEKTEDKE